ncbi:MAG: dTMP kinase [Alphaproteobacteria bacterium]|nr:dTMP kinase [Alphaproteobacteria bacterium]MBV9814194.1 dTMP kinase [Alphaproteobacteria bacterium]
MCPRPKCRSSPARISTEWIPSAASRHSPAIWCGVAAADVTGPRGRFISIEGGEGAGKSTQIALLAGALERAGIAVQATREPGGSPGAEAIRELLLEGEGERWDATAEALLLVAARYDHVTRVIAPALAQGVWVVSDRFADSTMAYQGYGRGVALTDLAALHSFALGEFSPDLTVILDLPVETGLARAAARSAADRFERLDYAFHERLRHGFQRIAADNPARCVLIDASGDPQTVHRTVLDAIAHRLGIAVASHPDLGRVTHARTEGKP